ncbi:unnamed protein product, partial [Polarella glacialis]
MVATVKSRILCPIILLLSLCLAPAAATGTGSGSSADAARCNNGQQAASNRRQDATTETVNVDAACMLQLVSEGLSGAVGSAGKRVLSQDEQESLKKKTHEGPAAVNLGKAGTYAILSKAGISTVPTSAITGNMGVSPIASTAITGFSLVADSTNTFATSTQVTGSVYGPDYASPTPSDLTVTIGDMEIAYTDAAGRHTPNFLNLGSGNLGGKTLAPGLYKFGSSVIIPTDCTIEGSLLSGETDTWIFQMSGDLIMAANKQVTLARGAKASNIVWQVAGYVEVEAGAHMEGILLVKTAAHFRTGSSLTGRILAQTAVTLQSEVQDFVSNHPPPFALLRPSSSHGHGQWQHEGPAAVNLGKAGTYTILSKTGISTVPTSAITGNMGVSPIASTAITGFSLVADSTNTFATSTQVTGSVYGPDYASPTPSDLTVTIGDMEIAYTDAAGRHTPNFLNLGSGNLGGKTLAPGLYKFGSSVIIPADCTIEGSLLSGETDTWIFQMSGDLIMAANKQVTLARGAKASNIVWQVAGYVEVEAGAHMEGILLVKTAAHFRTGSSLTGRILAQTAVTIQSST